MKTKEQIYKAGAKEYVRKLINCKNSCMGIGSNMEEQEYECRFIQKQVMEEVKRLLKPKI